MKIKELITKLQELDENEHVGIDMDGEVREISDIVYSTFSGVYLILKERD